MADSNKYTYEKYCEDRDIMWKLITEANHKNSHEAASVMPIPMMEIEMYVDLLHVQNKQMKEDYDYIRSGTILEMGDEIKCLPNYDSERWMRALEKELFRLVKCSRDHTKQMQERYQEKIALKRALFKERAERAKMAKYDSTVFEQYKVSHPKSVVSMKQWYGSWWKAEPRLREYAEKLK